jgi:hypothetical protein
MKKSKLNDVIKRYSLGGSVETVKFSVDDEKNLSINFISSDQTVVGNLSAEDIDIDECEFGIYDTSALKKLLSVLGTEIDFEWNGNASNDVSYIELKDDTKTKVRFGTCDLGVVPDSLEMDDEPDYNLELDLTQTFASKFCKSKSALAEITDFTVLEDTDGIKLILGHSESNTNKVSFEMTTKNKKDTCGRETRFSAEILKQILTANEIEKATMQVSDEGLMKLNFISDGIEVTYYLLDLEDED